MSPLTGTHVVGDPGEVADNNLRDVAIVDLQATTVRLTGDQTIAGTKNFTTSPTLNGAPIGTGGGAATTDASLLTTGTVADARLPTASQAATLTATFVNLTSAQTVGGTKNFTTSPTVNGAPIGTTGSTRTDSIWVDDMAGASDDAKFVAAYNYAKAQQYPPIIRFTNRTYTLTTGGLAPFFGMTIMGPEGYNNPEISGVQMGALITLNMTGGWFVNSSAGSTFSVSFISLSFRGSSTASVMTQTGPASMYCLLMRDISSSGLSSVLGTQASKLLITAATFDGGAWEINNSYHGAFHLGGSDNTLWPQGCLLDSNIAYLPAGGSQGQYHLWCDGLSKTTVGPMYITCEGGWGGLKVSGPTYNTGSQSVSNVIVSGARIEGRNPTHPCSGANVRVEGGQLVLNDCWVCYGMDNPAAMGHSPQDAGLIHMTTGRLVIRGGWYDRTSGQVETVPWVYAAGGSARVKDVCLGSYGGTWAGLPRVKAAGGTVVVDDTATAI